MNKTDYVLVKEMSVSSDSVSTYFTCIGSSPQLAEYEYPGDVTLEIENGIVLRVSEEMC